MVWNDVYGLSAYFQEISDMNPFMNFSNANRDRIRANNPDWKMTEVAKELGRLWREMSDSQKESYRT